MIKQVKAVPGDSWRLDGGRIIVNGELLRNSEGVAYALSDTRRLQLYVDDYPVLEQGMYLLLGNQPGGSLDASVFGLVDESDIIGLALANGDKKRN